MKERFKWVVKYRRPSYGRVRTMYRAFDDSISVELFIDYCTKKGWPWSEYAFSKGDPGRLYE